jgi:hypothetical protein
MATRPSEAQPWVESVSRTNPARILRRTDVEDSVKDFFIHFSAIFWEAMPFVVLGALIAGVLEEMVPQQAIARIVPKNRVLAIGLGGLLGLVFPMCECGIVPVMRRLIRKGLPLGTCAAYMLAGPIINVVVISSTVVAFAPHAERGGYQIIALRIGLGFLIACVTGLLVDRAYRKHGNDLLTNLARPSDSDQDGKSLMVSDAGNGDSKDAPRPSFMKRLGNISETALHDFTDITIFLSIGAVLAAISKQQFTTDDIQALSTHYPALSILAMMALAVLMCLCSEADAFVAASFTTLHPAAKLAFLVLGPMFDLKLLMLYTRVFRPRLMRTIIVSNIVQVFIIMMIVYYLWDSVIGPLYPRP